ncbi:aspartyl-phosphate phosphatase Spo0E family protein [Piscibacillus salipiscarius]|uniref:Aspartyl-phosphate phosphatase Spo0E family protein n=1 Tax=Piscibacillus salipiscarius TaxID=299480 RepID=A0ABW5QBC7_9BACI|nr:aspartyl-phosphate phosphatase Spo0E family protein [Piscibacillus salipiscarius]
MENVELPNTKKLEVRIKALKQYMISTAYEKGFNHPHTVKISQELDTVLNKYQTAKSKLCS